MKGILASVIVLATALTANAEGNKRYLVKMKSQTAFNSIVTQMRHNSPAFFQNPRVAQFQVFNQITNSTEALENVGLLVVEASDVNNLKNNPAVDYVEEEVMHPLPDFPTIALARGNPPPSNSVTVVQPWGIAAVKAPAAWATTRGESSTVLVLDTGVDKGHPAIRDRFIKGQNFVMDEQAVDDVTDGVGHGTHVSGTILASGNPNDLIGVAPRARLMMGRVCATEGCSSIAIVQGVNWGIDQQVQVMSLSLSGPQATMAEQDAFNRAEQANIVVVAASGNESKASVGFPAALPTVFAVGAVDSASNRAPFSNYGPELGIVAPGVDVYSSVPRGTGRASTVTYRGSKITSLQFRGSPAKAANDAVIAFANFGSVLDFQNIDAKGKVVLILRGGGVSFREKALNAMGAGAIGVLIANNKLGIDPGSVTTDGTEVAVPVIEIPQAAGSSIQNDLLSGNALTISMQVLATDYSSYQGTSMATPHVAGVVALVRAANPGLTAAQVRALLKDTATSLLPNDLNQYGAGLINADLAVKRALQTAPASMKLANGF
jgi:subtilisin family serine protease